MSVSEKNVPADQARRYAEASGDHNPIHLDDAFAKRVGLKGTILHGLCTMAFLGEHAVTDVGGVALLRRLKLRFSQPVYPGDRLRIESEAGAEPRRFKLRCVNQSGEEVVTGVQAEGSVLPPAAGASLTASVKFQEEMPVDEFTVTPAAIAAYVGAIDAEPGRYADGTAPPLFSSVFTLRPFLKAFLGELIKNPEDLRVLHASQEFEWARALKAGDRLTTRSGIERKATKGGQDFVYFATESRDAQGHLVVMGRSLAILHKS